MSEYAENVQALRELVRALRNVATRVHGDARADLQMLAGNTAALVLRFERLDPGGCVR